MKSTPSNLMAIGVLALSMVACASPRKASDRRCAKADRVLQKAKVRAAGLCPDAIAWDSARVVITTPPDSLQRHLDFAQARMDSVLAACAQLQEALAAEQQLNLLLPVADVVSRTTPPPRPQAAINNIRRHVCVFDPFTIDHPQASVEIRPGADRPLVVLRIKPQHFEASAPCPPQAARPPCPQPGVASWYRTAFWTMLVLIALVFVLGAASVVSFRWPG